MASSESSQQPRLERYPTPGSFLRTCLAYDTWHTYVALGTTLQYAVEEGDDEQPERGRRGLWLGVWTEDELELTLVRMGSMIILCSPRHSHSFSSTWLAPRMQLLASEYHGLVSSGSQPGLKSIRGARSLVNAFLDAYVEISAIKLPDNPLILETLLTHCPRPRATFNAPQLPEGHEIRLVRPADREALKQLAKLVQQFREGHPRPTERVDSEQALRAAEEGVRYGEMMVYVVRTPSSSSGTNGEADEGEKEEYVGYVSTGRWTGRTAGVRNVFTSPDWRRRGIAEALTRAAVFRLLTQTHPVKDFVQRYLPEGKEPKFERVCIFADKRNPSAQGLYARVGFGFPANEWDEEDGKSWEECVEVAYSS